MQSEYPFLHCMWRKITQCVAKKSNLKITDVDGKKARKQERKQESKKESKMSLQQHPRNNCKRMTMQKFEINNGAESSKKLYCAVGEKSIIVDTFYRKNSRDFLLI